MSMTIDGFFVDFPLVSMGASIARLGQRRSHLPPPVPRRQQTKPRALCRLRQQLRRLRAARSVPKRQVSAQVLLRLAAALPLRALVHKLLLPVRLGHQQPFRGGLVDFVLNLHLRSRYLTCVT